MEGNTQIRCPKCEALVPVTPEWRLAQCPRCGETIMRMGEDAAYD